MADLDEDELGLGISGTSDASIAMPSLGGDAGVAEQIGFTPASSGMVFPSPLPSLNISTPVQRTQSDQEYLQSLPTTAKIGLMLQSFSAGVAGRESPIDRVLKEKRARDQENRADLANTIRVIKEGTEILRKMPPGIARDAVARQLGTTVGGGDIAKVFELAGDQQQEVKEVLSTFSDPDVQGQLLKACSGSPDFRACVMTQARDKNFMDRAHAQADFKRIPAIGRKLTAALDQAGKTGVLDEYKNAEGKYEVPYAKLMEINAKAKIFSDDEMATIRRQETTFAPLGLKIAKAVEAGQVERAKIAERPTKEDFKEGQTRRIYDPSGTELQQEFKGGKWVTIGRRTKDKEAKPLTLAQERHDEQVQAARDYLTEHGLKTIADVRKLSEKETPTRPGGSVMKANPNYDPEAMRKWRLAGEPLFADTKAKREEAKGKGKETAPAAKTEPVAKPPAGQALSANDRQKVIAEATAAVNKGADPEAVKKRLKEKWGIEVSFTKKK